MRRHMLLAAAIIAVAVVAGVAALGAGAPKVAAEPPSCDVAGYDLNLDGKLTPADFRSWRIIGANCQLGSRVGGADCPATLDINRDGLVTKDDIVKLSARYQACTPRTGAQN